MKETIGKALILNRIRINSQRLTQKPPEKLRMPFVRFRSAAFLPQIRRKPGTKIIAFAVGHQRSQISREVPGVSIVLAEDVFEVFLCQQTRTASPNETAVPYRMFCLKTPQFLKLHVRGGRWRRRSACVFNQQCHGISFHSASCHQDMVVESSLNQWPSRLPVNTACRVGLRISNCVCLLHLLYALQKIRNSGVGEKVENRQVHMKLVRNAAQGFSDQIRVPAQV